MWKKRGKKIMAAALAAVMTCQVLLAGCGSDPSMKKHEVKVGETAQVNPLKGFFAYAGEEFDFPVSMEWFYIPVSAVHLAEGVFDWTALEFRLNEVAKNGHQAVLRFYYDCPGDECGIPQFLLDGGLMVRQYNEPDALGGGGLCPDYSDMNLRKSMQEFIAEFGKQYDGDARIAYITEGLLGFWGEWHNWPFDIDLIDGKPDWTIPAEVYDEVYQAYDNAFDKTLLLVREPKEGVDNAKYKTGFHDDSFAYATLSQKKGGQEWSYMQKMFNMNMENTWEYAPIGGEVYPPLHPYYFMEEYYKTKPNPATDPTADMAIRQDWDECVEESHASFMLINGIVNYADKTKENALEASMSLGYDLQVTNAYFADTLEQSAPLKLKVDIKNNGVAPFYYNSDMWPTLIGIKQNGTLVKQYYTNWSMSDVKADGKKMSFEQVVDTHGLGGGEYTINIKVQNPLDGGTIFSFANEGMNTDGWLELGSFSVTGDPVSSYPPVVSDVKPLVYTPAKTVADGENGMYQAENGTLEGVASLTDVEKAVGGQIVGWIGSGAEGTGSVTINNITVEETGFYNMDIAYVLGEASRNGAFDVNGGAEKGGDTINVKLTNTGGWSVLGTKNLTVFLKEGTNTLKYYNDNGWAASIDCVTFTKGSSNGINSIDGDLSDWGEAEAAYTDEFQTVTLNKDNSYLYFAIDAAGGIENCPDWSIRLDTAKSGISHEIKADGVYDVKTGTKLAGTGDDSRFMAAQNGNIIEVIVRRDVFEADGATLGSTMGYCVEFAKDGAAVHTSNGGELLSYELSTTALRLDVTKRFKGSVLRDWSDVNCVYNDELHDVWVTDDEEYLYFAADYDEKKVSFNDWSIEINVDSKYTTGYLMDWIWYWETTGNDYTICADGLYKYTNGAEKELISNGSDGTVAFSFTEDGKLEVKVKKSAIAELEGRRTLSYGVVFKEKGGSLGKVIATKKGERMAIYQLSNKK